MKPAYVCLVLISILSANTGYSQNRPILKTVEKDLFFEKKKVSQINDSVLVIFFSSRQKRFSKILSRTIDSIFLSNHNVIGKTYLFNATKGNYYLDCVRTWVDYNLIQKKYVFYINRDTLYNFVNYEYEGNYLKYEVEYRDTTLAGEYNASFYVDSTVYLAWSDQGIGYDKTIVFKNETDLDLRDCSNDDVTAYYFREVLSGYYLRTKEKRGQYWLDMSVKKGKYGLWKNIVYHYRYDLEGVAHKSQHIITKRRIYCRRSFYSGTKPQLLTTLSYYLNHTSFPYSPNGGWARIPMTFEY